MNKVNYRNYEYIISKNINLVYTIASRFDTSTVNEDRIIQAGMLGLLRAAIRFNVSQNDEFSKYAVSYILLDIKKELNKEKSEYRI